MRSEYNFDNLEGIKKEQERNLNNASVFGQPPPQSAQGMYANINKANKTGSRFNSLDINSIRERDLSDKLLPARQQPGMTSLISQKSVETPYFLTRNESGVSKSAANKKAKVAQKMTNLQMEYLERYNRHGERQTDSKKNLHNRFRSMSKIPLNTQYGSKEELFT